MKKLIIILVLVVGAYLIYDQLNKPLSEDAQKVETIETKFKSIRDQISQARRSAGLGLDSTSSFDSAFHNLKNLLAELKQIKSTLSEEEARKNAQELEQQITNYIRSVEGR